MVLRLRRMIKLALFVVMVTSAIVGLVSQMVNNDKGNEEEIDGLEGMIRAMERGVAYGLGEGGRPAYLEGVEKGEGEESMQKYAINIRLSDKVALNRSVGDVRDERCSKAVYNIRTDASVIIIYFNEPFSVLMRTVWSVLNRTPLPFLREIILVDDASTEANLTEMVDHYINTRMVGRPVWLHRLRQRSGLIRARLEGARMAKGSVLVFLDAHCEATAGWIEPLLARIQEDRSSVAIPVIDVIEADTLAYQSSHDVFVQIGGFTWNGQFTWIDMPESATADPDWTLKPILTPTMAGGLFAINRMYFWEVGSYDEQMDGWGGENLEMSFRVWQCGGALHCIPCSHVGHIFRDFRPYKLPHNRDTHSINTARLAHVWMDRYAEFYFMHEPQYRDNFAAIGDLTHRQALRSKLHCRSFKWYLDNVYPQKFVFDEHSAFWGRVQTPEGVCLDNLQLEEEQVGNLGVFPCMDRLEPTQTFALTDAAQLRQENHCAEADARLNVVLVKCGRQLEGQHWTYNDKTGRLVHSSTRLCLTSARSEQLARLTSCHNTTDHQVWKFDFKVKK